MLILSVPCCCINKELGPSGAAGYLKSNYDRCGSKENLMMRYDNNQASV
jgi:hypothetical protein